LLTIFGTVAEPTLSCKFIFKRRKNLKTLLLWIYRPSLYLSFHQDDVCRFKKIRGAICLSIQSQSDGDCLMEAQRNELLKEVMVRFFSYLQGLSSKKLRMGQKKDEPADG
jgi:hypothetical protein